MFYSTRRFWRAVLPALAVYLAVTKIPWDSLGSRLGAARRRIEWTAGNLGRSVGDGLEDLLRGITNLIK
jgi:hypothetical protein